MKDNINSRISWEFFQKTGIVWTVQDLVPVKGDLEKGKNALTQKCKESKS